MFRQSISGSSILIQFEYYIFVSIYYQGRHCFVVSNCVILSSGWEFVFVIYLSVNISGKDFMFSQDAKGEGKKAFFVDKFSLLLCWWWDAFYVRGIWLHGIISTLLYVSWNVFFILHCIC